MSTPETSPPAATRPTCQRLISLDRTNSLSETLTVKPISIPADFYRIQLGIYQHLCEDG